MSMFSFVGKKYSYFAHSYNRATENMRTIEIPIIKEILRLGPLHVLEIGNVLSHYGLIRWPVLDKYERGTMVINEDLKTYETRMPFDLIVSISTIEHIGFGKYTHTTLPKPSMTDIFLKIKSLLTPAGTAYITVPVGFNPNLDRYLVSNPSEIQIVGCMRRINNINDWKECTLIQAIEEDKYRGDYPWSKGMVVLKC